MSEFTSDDFMNNPSRLLGAMREEAAIVRRRAPFLGKVWVTTNQSSAAAILKDNVTFTQRKSDGSMLLMRWWMPRSLQLLSGNMLNSDEPDHTRLRKLVDQAFHRKMILALEPNIEKIANELVENLFVQNDRCDLVDEFARVFPLSVICEMLGLPEEDREIFSRWAEGLTKVTGLISIIKALPGLKSMTAYLQERIEHVRAHGGKGMIANLVQAEAEGARLSSDELVAMVFLLLVAGHETTTHLISGGVLALLQNPEQKQLLLEDWGRADLAVEELLRFVSPVAFTKPRYPQKDVEIEGVQIRKGELIMPCLVAANYDPAVIDAPEKLDLMRRPNRHMGFGAGIHFCLGHQLARLEGRVALQALFTRYPQLALADEQVHWRKRFGLRALDRLDIVSGL